LSSGRPPDDSLGAVWRRLARAATDGQLAACAAALPLALAVALAVVFTRPHWAVRWWPAVAAPMLVGAFGLWGIGDRERGTLWRAIQVAAVAVASLSASVLGLWFLQRVIGTWNL
jgi:hypothetical protein